MKKIFWFLGLTIILVLIWKYQTRKVILISCSNCEDSLLKKIVAFQGQTVKAAVKEIGLVIRSQTNIGAYQIKEQKFGYLLIEIKKKEPKFSLKKGTNDGQNET